MRHLKKKYRLVGGKDERRALLRSLASSLIEKGKIRTTLARAKALRAYFDKLVTLAKKTDLHHKRILISRLGNNKRIAFKLINEVVPKLSSRQSGFTSFRQLNPRRGDNTLLAEVKVLFDEEKKKEETKVTPAKKKESAPKKTKPIQKKKVEAKGNSIDKKAKIEKAKKGVVSKNKKKKSQERSEK